MASPAPSSAKVKRYHCLYSNQVNKKHKSYQDGFIRHHHLNSRVYLFSLANEQLAQSFFRPPRNGSLSFVDEFSLEGEQVEFQDEGYHVEVSEVEWEGKTDLGDIRASTLKAKIERLAAVKEWARSEDARHQGSTSSSTSTSSSPSPSCGSNFPRFGASDLLTTPSSTKKKEYRGFGIAPPVAASTGKASINSTSARSESRSSPYSPTTLTNTPSRAPPTSSTLTSTPIRRRNEVIRGTPPSTGVRAEFKPPRPSGASRLNSALSEFND